MTMWAKFISSLLNISFTYTPRVNYYIYFLQKQKNKIKIMLILIVTKYSFLCVGK